MKVIPDHVEQMRIAMAPTMERVPFEVYRNAGLSGKRYRWDVMRSAGLLPFICNTLYLYCDDSHIDTALRAICEHKE